MTSPTEAMEFPLPEGYRFELFGRPGAPTVDDVIGLWTSAGVFDDETRGRRAHETLLTAVGPQEQLAGIFTVHLMHSRQLGMAFWAPMVYVDPEHRRTSVAAALGIEARRHLTEQYVSGADRRAAGILTELQNPELRARSLPAEWGGFSFVGQSRGGFERSVYFFPGVEAPPAPGDGPAPSAGVSEVAAAPAAPLATAEGPVFLVAAPGAEAEVVRDALAGAAELVAVDGAQVLDPLTPEPGGHDGARLTAEAATADLRDAARAALEAAAGDGRPLVLGAHDAVRVPFLEAAFPDATFVFLHRAPGEAVPAALAEWQSGAHATVPAPPGWDAPPWSHVLTPGWRALRDAALPEVVAAQWEAATRTLVADLQRLAPERWSVIDHATLRADPVAELGRLGGFLGVELEPGVELEAASPAPSEVEAVLDRTADTAGVARALFAEAPTAPVAAPRPPAPGEVRSAITQSLARLLAEIHASVLVAAPDAGAVVILRRAGDEVNTHLARADRVAGIAVRGDRLALSTPLGVAELRDVPAARARFTGGMGRDAVYLPRSFHHTGEAGIGEIAWAGDDLWAVASRFSCLATLDADHSFVPRWLPPSVTALDAQDRCELNGLCVVGDEVRWVTADRDGVVIDVRDGRTVAEGLDGPRSPRWHDGRLWVLQSRAGTLCTVDPADGAVETVARVPGRAAGLAFAGPLAFVGVSPALEGEPRCGVWVIDVRSGDVAGFAEFTAGVEAIADVQILPGRAFPEIAEPGSDAARNAFVLPED